MTHSQATNEHILNRADMINMIAKKINAKTYLEIGVQTGKTFRAIEIENKIGVDPDPQWEDQTHIMGSDQFFDQLEDDQKFDIIFIDGLHQWEQVARDIANAVDHLNDNGVILVDDCAPKHKAYQTTTPTAIHWTGDVWRAWLLYRHKLAQRGFFSCTYDVAFGLGILHKYDSAPVFDDLTKNLLTSAWKIPYEKFAEHFDTLLSFQTVYDFKDSWGGDWRT